jgi:ATP synthase protein I
MSTIKAPPIYKIVAYQLILIAAISSALLILSGHVSAYSLLIGGLLSALPSALFARRVFKYRGARAAHKIVKQLYTGQALKLVLMSAGFALSFYYIQPLNVVALFSGFILVHIAGLFILSRVIRGKK